MARAVTLAQLRADVRLYADQRVPDEANAFVTATELNRLVNLQLAELYDLLVAARGHEYYAADSTIDLTPDTAEYDLPEDFYQLQSVAIEWAADDHEPVNALNHQQDIWRFASSQQTWDRWTRKAYRIRNGSIEFFPTPRGAATVRLRYIPVHVDLAEDDDTFDGVNGWEKLVALGAA